MFLIFCFGNLTDLSLSVISSLSCEFPPPDSSVHGSASPLKAREPASFPFCHSVSLLPLEAKPQRAQPPLAADTSLHM